ncbi:MAG: zinc-ribbon domain-containing protein [Myxococcota bacterium]
MIVRCPECSTGFKLPKDKITSKGVKLRCSKCSHVFRIRSTDEGDTEIFYTDADDGPPKAGAGEDDVSDEAAGSKTQFGMPNVNKDADGADESAPAAKQDEDPVDDSAGSRSAQPDYNPFPHAGDSIKPKKESSFDSSSAAVEQDEAAEDSDDEENLDLFDEDDRQVIEDDPFEGAFDDAPVGGESEKTTQAPGPAASRDSEPDDAGDSDPLEPEAPEEAEAPKMDEVPTDDDSAFWSQQEETGFGSAEDMVDPAFGEDGAYFDPQQGKVNQPQQDQQARKPAKNPEAASSQEPKAKAAASGGGTPTSGGGNPAPAEQATPTAAKSASSSNSGQPQSPSTGSANKKTSWDVEQPLEPHTVGGSGMQKVANFLLITLIVIGLFFAVLAVMSGGVIDFKRLPHTLEVAFQGKEFEPREAWIPEPPPVRKAPVEDPIRFEGVVGNVIEADDQQMLAVRGRVKNADDTPYEGVRVRAMLQDGNGRVVTEQEAHIGKRLDLEAVMAIESVEELQQLMPAESPDVAPNSSQPFTIVFPAIPERLQKSADLSYKVELAAGDPVGGVDGSKTGE